MQPWIHCRLSCQGNGKMQRLLHLLQPFINCLLIALKTLQIFYVGLNAAFHNFLGFVNRAFPFRPRVIYVAPAENASVVAVESRAHLYAAPAFNAVKSVLIADILPFYSLF